MTTHTTPAVWYARIFGIVLTLVGVLGLAITTSQSGTEPLLGFDVNLTHNLVHVLTGVFGLVAGFGAIALARTYAGLLGVVYTVVGVWGMVDDNPLGLFGHINPADNVLHLAIGVVGLVAASLSTSSSTTVAR